MKKIIMMIAAALLVAACTEKAGKPDKEMDRFISNLMSKMTIEEKIGQLNLSGGDIPGVLSGANGIDDIIKEENLDTKPAPIKYELEPISYRHYGKNIERMIQRAAEYPEGEERDALVMLLANHMKKLIYQINNEDVEDAKIFKDLARYSHGAIRLDPETHHLHEYQVVKPVQSTGKKKKKK